MEFPLTREAIHSSVVRRVRWGFPTSSRIAWSWRGPLSAKFQLRLNPNEFTLIYLRSNPPLTPPQRGTIAWKWGNEILKMFIFCSPLGRGRGWVRRLAGVAEYLRSLWARTFLLIRWLGTQARCLCAPHTRTRTHYCPKNSEYGDSVEHNSFRIIHSNLRLSHW